MSKVFIKRKKLNEDVSITDPTLAQQYLMIRKQITDKRTKRDQIMRSANQIDAEINILEKNLIAIETKAVQQQGELQVKKQATEKKEPEEGEEKEEETSESLKEAFKDTRSLGDYIELVISSIDRQYVDGETLVFEFEDILKRCFNDKDSVETCAKLIIDADRNVENEVEESGYIGGDNRGKFIANRSTPIRVAEFLEFNVEENIPDKYEKFTIISIDGKEKIIEDVEKYPNDAILYFTDGTSANASELEREGIEFVRELRWDEIEEIKGTEENDEGLKDWLDNEEKILNLKTELKDLQQEERDIRMEMEEDLADYEETTYQPKKSSRYSLTTKEITEPTMPHDYWGEKLNDIEEQIRNKEKEIRELGEKEMNENLESIFKPKTKKEIAKELLNNSIGKNREELINDIKTNIDDFDDEAEAFIFYLSNEYTPSGAEIYLSKDQREELYNLFKKGFNIAVFGIDYDDYKDELGEVDVPDFKKYVKSLGWDEFWFEDNIDQGEFIFIKNPKSIEEQVDREEWEKGKISTPPIGAFESTNESVYDDIINDLEDEKNKINKIQDFILQTTQKIEIDIDTPDEIEIKDEEPEILEPEPIELEPMSADEELPMPMDLVTPSREIPEESPFEPTQDEKLVDETLKVEDKEPYEPELMEEEDVETELELLNYEEEDEPQDEYVFHVRIDSDLEGEIVAKIYRDSEDDYWTIRVVKGDEEPLQSMQLDPRLDKLEIIGYLADFYNEIEIIDKKEYEYLLDDKDEIDAEYYGDLAKIQ